MQYGIITTCFLLSSFNKSCTEWYIRRGSALIETGGTVDRRGGEGARQTGRQRDLRQYDQYIYFNPGKMATGICIR